MLGNAIPRIRNLAIKLIGVQPMHHAPSTAAKRHNFFTLTRARTTRSIADDVIDFVGAYGRDGSDPPLANSITLLSDDVGNQQHSSFVIRPRARRNLLQIRLALLVLAKQPIDRSICGDTGGNDLAAFALCIPLSEQAIECHSSSTITIVTTCRGIISPQRLIRNCTTQFSIEGWDVEVESGRAACERFGDDESRKRSCEHHKSSAASRSRRSSGSIALSRSSRSHSWRLPSCTRG